MIIEINIRKLKKYCAFVVFSFSEANIFATNRIKKGFINSTGCNRKRYKLNQRFEPLTSTPITGTNIKRINRIILEENGFQSFGNF